MHLKLDLVLQFGRFPNAAAHRAVLRKARVASWIEPALRHPAEIAVRVVGEDEAQALNLQYRGRDYADQRADLRLCARALGQCRPGAVRAGRRAGGPRASARRCEAHYAHLLVHGTLHAQGYDHETGERDALEMEALEVLLLGSLGFRNPY